MSLVEKLKEQKYIIIAEIGVNYYDIAVENGISIFDAAKLMCKEAYLAGADAVKFQTYKAETLASKYSPAYWDTTEEATLSQYELFKKFDRFGKKEYEQLADYCKNLGIVFLSTPFDYESSDYLYDLMELYKISSSDITNLPFIEHIAKKNKPIILSTGASNLEEIQRAYNLIKENGNWLALLHCVLEYPTPYEDANLKRITALKRNFPNVEIGYSDHTKPVDNDLIITTAYALGAKIIEKHFTLDKTLCGNDHYHAMDVDDLKRMKKSLERQKEILGEDNLSYLETEACARENARRSIVLKNSVTKGHTILESDLCFKRPGIGISPNEAKKVIGMIANRDLSEDEILKWEYIE